MDWNSLIELLVELFPLLKDLLEILVSPEFLETVTRILRIIAIAAAVTVVVGALFALLTYILRSIALFTLGKRRGCRVNGLAWVPGLWVWTLGSIADSHEKTYSKDHKWRHVLLWLYVAALVCSCAASLFGSTVTIEQISSGDITFQTVLSTAQVVSCFTCLYSALMALIKVLTYICYGKVFEACAKHPVALTVLSVAFPVILPFALMSIRKKDAPIAVKAEE